MKMQSRVLIVSALLIAGAWLLWPRGGAPSASPNPAAKSVAPAVTGAPVAATNHNAIVQTTGTPSAASTNRLTYRLSNTTNTIGQLMSDRHAILLENALIETDAKIDLAIPKHLRATGEPGAFIVQARGVIDAAFRAALAGAGGQVVSYIPNNAYLVQLTTAGAAALAGNPLVQAVLPYAPYYKVQSTLLGLAVKQQPLPVGTYLTLGLYSGSAAATEAQIQALGGEIVGRDRSPFGSIVRVQPPVDWLALVQLPGVQIVEPTHRRVSANDLSRVMVGVSTDTKTATSYMNLTGNNVLVEVNDTGIDATHPDLTARIFGDTNTLDFGGNSLVDVPGHGTLVAGIIAGNGSMSSTLNGREPQGSTNGADFRGKAPLAKLYSFAGIAGGNDAPTYTIVSDQTLQEAPARTNALISNNSWVNDGVNQYDLSAASYDAATRDALVTQTGPQPVLFVFAAGNGGGGGISDSIMSPGTAKNVITVGALEQYRQITNSYTDAYGNVIEPWLAETSSSNQVAWYSSRGNVGIGTEGIYGRFKPDVVAPGTFVVSTRSSEWVGQYNPTNYSGYDLSSLIVATNYTLTQIIPVPANAVDMTLNLNPVALLSPTPFPGQFLPMTLSANGTGPTITATNTFTPTPTYLSQLITGGGILDVTVTDNSTNSPVVYQLDAHYTLTNVDGNFLIVKSNLDYSLGPWYRYGGESYGSAAENSVANDGTSIAAAAASGVLALIQDYFTNTLHLTPSPALLKAMLVNGARPSAANYGYSIAGMNYEGWGVVNISNSLPANTSPAFGSSTPLFFLDQSPNNRLKTGDSRTYTVTVPASSQVQRLRISLAWTDPPGNPVAALKLVNRLGLVATNLTTGEIYYGNSFAYSSTDSLAYGTNSPPLFDLVNNVQNIVIAPTSLQGVSYSVTITGLDVNVNAVTTEQTNIVQDFALVISSDDSEIYSGIQVSQNAALSTPVTQVSYLSGSSGIYYNQLVGAAAPLLNTSNVLFGPGSSYATGALDYFGQMNQWHFYVITNTTTFTNAAFVIFVPSTLAIPRMGGYAGSDANSTLPEANLDLYVATAPSDPNAASLTNLNPTVIQNCISGLYGDSANLARGGTKFIAFSNAALGQVFYVGVKCEDQTAAEYNFIGTISPIPFSGMDTNGNEFVNGIIVTNVPPDGNNAHPGVGYVVGLAQFPIELRNVIVTNQFYTQNFGDLVGFLTHDTIDTTTAYATLNNHNEMVSPSPDVALVYDDGVTNGITNSFVLHSDGPGSLQNFIPGQGAGVWILTEVDDAYTQSNSVISMTLLLQPHQPTNKLEKVTVLAGAWYYDYIYVPGGVTNLTVVATNETPPYDQGVLMALQYGTQPTTNNNQIIKTLNQGGPPPGNSISVSSPTPGIYYVGFYNPSTTDVTVLWGYSLGYSASALTTVDYPSTDTPLPILDDAITVSPLAMTDFGRTNSTIYVPPGSGLIQDFNVGLRVDHPRISDLVFTLVDPSGNRYLLMENRGNSTTNGCGATMIVTNTFVPVTSNGSWQADTNPINISMTSGTFPITYNFYTIPDEMTVYYGTNIASTNLIWDSGMVGNQVSPIIKWLSFPPAGVPTNSTYLTIIMNQFGNSNSTNGGGDLWTYTAGGVFTNYEYLTFTENTNLTTTPIKFAPPPFVPSTAGPLTNLYYQAEQSLSPIIGTTADGAWELEVLDNRAGATNPAPMLLSWRLEFVLAPYITPLAVPLAVSANSLSANASVIGTNAGKASVTSSGSQLSWSAAIGASYQVQWKDSLAAPWNTITNPITTMVNGVSTFVDDGTQTAPIGSMRFYRLVKKP